MALATIRELILTGIGAGESGKSTILKQMRLIHTDGFPLHERKEVRQVIFSNLVVAFKIIGDEMRELGLSYDNDTSASVSTSLRNSWESLIRVIEI